VTVFADTSYWIAITNPNDNLHEKAKEATAAIGKQRILTTDAVLAEYLNFFCGHGDKLRMLAASKVKAYLSHANVDVIPAARDQTIEGLDLYVKRPDKQYSHTDCVSMVVMQKRGIDRVLTSDRHFTQEGFIALLV
jgi:predicted nucleic acid-binding protein